MNNERDDDLIDRFVACSRTLNGSAVGEREQWNNEATADAIRHFAYGISDDNPMWIDPGYAEEGPYGSLAAPPSFLASVLYPGLHGYPMDVPLSSLISDLSYEWYRPVLEGDELRGVSRQVGVREATNRQGRRLVYVQAEVDYCNGNDESVARAKSTMVRLHQASRNLLVDREIHRYSKAELSEIERALREEKRTGAEKPPGGRELQPGYQLPVMVRGPLTIGDLIAWQAAIGPSYRAASLAFRDGEGEPHTMDVNPVTGWRYKYSQQHEDFLVARQRGMPAPFDNAVMRFAWLSTMLTNWIGDYGFLRSLSMNAIEPVLYGDTNWYRGEITACVEDEGFRVASIRLSGQNQLGQITTTGHAEIEVPAFPHVSTVRRRNRRTAPDPDAVNSFTGVLTSRTRQHPDKPAVISKSGLLTYRELDHKAESLCACLRRQRVGSNYRVGVLVRRSLDSIVAAVGILKAGATYVPLDEMYPRDELSAMIAEAQIDIMVTHNQVGDEPTVDRASVINMDSIEGVPAEQASDEMSRPKDSDVAYIMFTSGTTGAPKAVAVTRHSMHLYLATLNNGLDVHEQDKYLNVAPFCFSASIRQTLFPLYCGCTIVLADEEERRNQHALLELIRDNEVSVWDTVPTSVRMCVDYVKHADSRTGASLLRNRLRLILTTGEALPVALPTVWRNEMGHCARFVSLYSQTETSGTVCVNEVSQSTDEGNRFVPLGEPLNGVELHILDESMNPVMQGEVGELYVGGRRVAKGYVNQPRLSGRRFVPDPFSPDSSARLYRTGDLVYRSPDGVMHFSGRADTRIKFNGYRIELSRIEAELEAYKGISKAVVDVKEDGNGVQRLVGYLVSTNKLSIQADELRRYLKGKLADFMIPSAYLELPEVPVNESGKTDRRRLPGLEEAGKNVSQEADPGRCSPKEAELLRIWKDVLEVQNIQVDDDFFYLGGDSLHATQICLRCQEKFGTSLRVVDLFECSTVSELAKRL